MRWSLIFILIGGGCTLSHETSPVGPEPEVLSVRFVGDWIITEPPLRGGYAATVYRFTSDGDVFPLASVGDRGPEPLPLAAQATGLLSLFCNDPLSWSSDDDLTLVITSRCTGTVGTLGIDRDATLVVEFGPDETQNVTSPRVELVDPATFFLIGPWRKCEALDSQCDEVRDCPEVPVSYGECYRH